MFGHKQFLNAGYGDDETIGDVSGTLLELAQGFLPGSFLAPVGDALAGAASGSIPTPFTDTAPTSSAAKVTAPSGLKLRSQPNENSTWGTLLAQGTPLTIIKTGFPSTNAAPKGWTHVRTESGSEGYVSTEWLSISSPTSATSGNTSSPYSPAAALSTTKPTSSSSFLDNKLLLAGGAVALVVVIGAVALGGSSKKKKAA